MTARTRNLVILLLVLVIVAPPLYWFVLRPQETKPIEFPHEVAPVEKPAPPKPAIENMPPPQEATPVTEGPVPVTLSALGLMPPDTDVAVGIPTFSALQSMLIPLVQKAFKNDLDVQTEFDRIAREAAAKVGLTAEGTASEVFRTMGFDPDGPGALFIKVSAMVTKAATEFSTSIAAGTPPVYSPPERAGAPMVLVLPVSSAEAAEKTIQTIFADSLKDAPMQQEEVDGVKLTIYPNLGAYFTAQNKFVVGDNVDMVKAVLPRLKAPAQFRYGSMACPAEDNNEFSTMVYMRRMLPAIKAIIEAPAKKQPALAEVMNAQLQRLEKMFGGDGPEDPAVITVVRHDDRIEMRQRMDMATHPGLSEMIGVAQPLRIATYLPEDTMAFLSLRFNDANKRSLTDGFEATLNAREKDKNAAKIAGYANQAVKIVGDELVLGVSGVKDLDLPGIYAMLGITNQNMVQLLLGFAGVKLHETYKDVAINSMEVPFPIQLYTAFADDIVIVSSSPEGMKGIIDRIKEKKSSGMLAAQMPAIDESVPRYAGFLIRTGLYTDVVRPLMNLMGAGSVSPDVEGALVEFSKIVRDLRNFAETNGTWYEVKTSLSLMTAEGAVPAQAAEAPAAAPVAPQVDTAAPAPEAVVAAPAAK